MHDGILVLVVGEAEIRAPDGGVLAGDGVNLLRVQIAVVGIVVLAGQDALSGHRAEGLQQRASFRRRVGINRLAVIVAGGAAWGNAVSAPAIAAAQATNIDFRMLT